MYYLPSKKSFLSIPLGAWLSRNSILSLEWEDRQVRFVVLKKTDNKAEPYSILSFGSRDIPSGAIIEGVIYKPDVLARVLSDIKKQTKQKYAVAVLNDSTVYTFPMQVEMHKNVSYLSILRHKLDELVPQTLTKTVLYYNPIRIGAKYMDVLVRAIPLDLLKSYRSVFALAGMKLTAAECLSDSIARMVSNTKQLSAQLVVHVGHNETTCSIVSNGVVHEIKTVLVGGRALTLALQTAHGVIGHENVLKHKKTKGYTRHAGGEVLYNVASLLQTITDEIQQLINSQNKNQVSMSDTLTIEKVVLLGEDVTYEGFISYIASKIDRPVECANVWRNLYDFNKTIPKIVFADSLVYASLIGVAVGKLQGKRK